MFQIKYHPDGPDGEEVEVDFTPPFARVPMIATLEKLLNVKLPPPEQFDSQEANTLLSQLCEKHEVMGSMMIILIPKKNYKFCINFSLFLFL